ncbi:UNVERIFIED_CONTAM: hypothetical protein GTU68_026809 [Idotea baltica]|nr:hypothetical protein [Idotea baltica]
MGLWDMFPEKVSIVLPKGEMPEFEVVDAACGDGWAQAGIIKDAGDDPDVTHGVTVNVRVTRSGGGVVFKAGEGIGVVTKAGLPIGIGEPAINPVPRAMMDEVVAETASDYGQPPDIEITVSIPNGAEIAQKTWNPRLGIKGGLSVLGTTGIVRPFSCAAWIASIHRGIDVAVANGLDHVAGCTGNTSEKVIQAKLGLPDHAMLDMGDFAGGVLKYLARHPVKTITLGGGIGKMTKLAQGALDLHSGRSQVDFKAIAERYGRPGLAQANTALEVYEMLGAAYAMDVSRDAQSTAQRVLEGSGVQCHVVVIDRAGTIIGEA